MKKMLILFICSLVLSSCHLDTYVRDDWIQKNEDGPSKHHSYLVIKNHKSNAYIGILKKQNELSSFIVNNGLEKPKTNILIKYHDNKEISHIEINENIDSDEEALKQNFVIKKLNGKWIVEEISE